ncbi:unnamed protein product [Linum trigynum]|uniref:Uncharacterized protein n=1 Tax=Linum trigynum TaxID=586398 RepID=A0AAV2CT37_9ROSI
MPPGPFIATNPRVIVLLDGKSFPVLFDLSKVEKKDLFTGTYMPSTDLTGGYRILSYLGKGQAKRNAGEGGISVLVLPTYRRYLPIPCSVNRVAQIPARLPIPSVNGLPFTGLPFTTPMSELLKPRGQKKLR